MNDKYEVKGGVRALQQRKSWKGGLDHLPNLDSFDIEFSPTGKVLLQTDYTHATVVYGSSRFIYDGTDRLIQTLEFDGMDAQVAASEYQYFENTVVWTTRDATGAHIRSGVEKYAGKLLTHLETYDANGRIKRLKLFEYVEGKLSKAVSRYYGSEGSLSEISISHFDSLGRVVEAFGLTPDGEPNGDGRYTYEYDDEGRKHRILSYNDLADSQIPNSVKQFVYECDEQGNWTKRCEYFRFRTHAEWTKMITTRELTYYLMGES